jgi:hypothetical protein
LDLGPPRRRAPPKRARTFAEPPALEWGVNLTWYLGVDVPVVVLGAVLIIWLLRHRAASRNAQRLLQDRLRFETLLSELSAKLIHIEASGLDAALEAALRQMVTFLGTDRGNLDEYRDGAPGVRVTWAEPGVEKLPSILAVDHLVWTADTLRRGAVVRFSRTDELPAEAATDRMGYERLGTPPTCRSRCTPADRCWGSSPLTQCAANGRGRMISSAASTC